MASTWGLSWGGDAGSWLASWSLAAADDTTPDAFSFTDQSGVALSSTITSAPITVTGITAAAAITISGDASSLYIINGGTPTADPGTVVSGDEVQARHTSSANHSTAVDTTVTIGGVSDTFTSTTLIDPASVGGYAAIAAVTRRRLLLQ